MSEPITTTQLLDFLAKAHKVSPDVKVVRGFNKGKNGYKITVLADWYNDDHFDETRTFVTNDGTYEYNQSYTCFFEVDSDLNHLVKEEEEREIKRKKRQELLSRLTDEEKELLGVKS